MESEVDKASHQHPKCRKLTNKAQFSSTSVKDSILTLPVLPADLITEILLRVPVKPLLKFRSVSKSWLALISSPEFIKAHLSVSANNKDQTHHRMMWSSLYRRRFSYCNFSSIFNDSVTEVFDLHHRMTSDGLYNNELPRCVTVLCSVNGLICIVDDKCNVFLWNPSNRKYKKLPNPSTTLWFQESLMYGFGYDELHDDYKVVGTFCRRDKFGFMLTRGGELMIYSLKSDSWGSVDDCRLRKCKGRTEADISGIFVNGKLYWPNAICRGGYISNYKHWKIISFDLANEKWGEVEHPCYKEGYIALFLGLLGSDLSIFCDNSGSHVDFWVMKEYGVNVSWTKMFTINYPSGTSYPAFFMPCFMSNKGEVFVTFVKPSIYNLRDASFRKSEVIDYRGRSNIAIYVESLVCPFSKQGDADATKHKRLKKFRSRKPSNKDVPDYYPRDPEDVDREVKKLC